MSSNNNNNNNNNIGQTNGGQQVCLKRPESGLSAVFEEMYLSERLVDVTLSCNNGQIQAHKLVLAACSPYFSGVFDKLANPFQYPVIVIKDMQIEDLKLIVDFMYRGNLTIGQDRLESLIKCAESLQITGLSNLDNTNCLAGATTIHLNGETTAIVNVEAPRLAPVNHQKSSSSKRAKRMHSSNQVVFERTYHHMRVHHHHNSRNDDLSPDKLLEQSMMTGDAHNIDSQQFSGYATGVGGNQPTSTKNLANSNHHHHGLNSSASSLQMQHAMNMHPQHQLQVLSHSLTTNRSSSSTTNAQTTSHNGQLNLTNDGSNNNNGNNDQSSSSARGRLHPCHICWKTFRERANLKRHLQIHSQDRVMYACIECNKTFSWKDNYIRHTKTTHHMNNARQQA